MSLDNDTDMEKEYRQEVRDTDPEMGLSEEDDKEGQAFAFQKCCWVCTMQCPREQSCHLVSTYTKLGRGTGTM